MDTYFILSEFLNAITKILCFQSLFKAKLRVAFDFYLFTWLFSQPIGVAVLQLHNKISYKCLIAEWERGDNS